MYEKEHVLDGHLNRLGIKIREFVHKLTSYASSNALTNGFLIYVMLLASQRG